MTYFFRFESDQERSLAYIPMLVRMKLDLAGVKLTLKQWNRLPERDRRRLFEFPCEGEFGAKRYRELLSVLVRVRAGESLCVLPPQKEPAWNNVREIPEQVARRAMDRGLPPPSIAQWRALSPAQRYALLKLTRDGHESRNYLPALKEFELL